MARRRSPEDLRAAVAKAYAEGEGAREIAVRLGCSKKSVYAWAREAGVPVRSKRGPVPGSTRAKTIATASNSELCEQLMRNHGAIGISLTFRYPKGGPRGS